MFWEEKIINNKKELTLIEDERNTRNNMFEFLEGKLFHRETDPAIKYKYLAFLRQSNVTKYVYWDWDSGETRVVFAYCNQDIRHKGELNLLGQFFFYVPGEQSNPNKLKSMEYFRKEIPIDQET